MARSRNTSSSSAEQGGSPFAGRRTALPPARGSMPSGSAGGSIGGAGSPAGGLGAPSAASDPGAAPSSAGTAPSSAGTAPSSAGTAPSSAGTAPSNPSTAGVITAEQSPELTVTSTPDSTEAIPSAGGVGRIPVLAVGPVVDGGRWPAKAVVGEAVPITATVFREGHDAVAATAVLTDPDGVQHSRVRLVSLGPGLDRLGAWVTPDREGSWTFRVEGWGDPYGTWEHDAVIKVEAAVDTEVMLESGARLMERALSATDESQRDPADTAALSDALLGLRDGSRPAQARLAAGTAAGVHAAMARNPLRDVVTATPEHRLTVQRRLALFCSWYELFPRSEGAHVDENGRWVSGTLRTAERRIPVAAAMGFDIVYLPPIHPVGKVNRKGPNNTLDPQPGDPGSPWAIGSDEGGHDAVHPDLGTVQDVEHFAATCREHGLELALDLALQCAPDHPWAREHPEWFTTRVDGSIAFAENPPKKYQDIYPMNFDNDPGGVYTEVLRVVNFWIDKGVTVFRVDNPHTKPVQFWEWLIGRVNADHPEVLFLAEAFTRPAMMHTLAKAGFHQSYTYFTWRTSGYQLTEYLSELSGSAADYMRPNFWPNTPDILHDFLQYGGPAAFKLRAVLASTLSPCWGMYSGYELCEHVAVRQGSEEYLDSEKYQYRPRDWESYQPGGSNEGRSIAPYITRLNHIRRDHLALQRLRNTVFHRSDDDQLLVYSRRLEAEQAPDGREDALIVVVNLDPHGTRETTVHLDMPALGMDWPDSFTVHDLITGDTFRWYEHNYVRLDPHYQPAHVLHIRRL